ncbi:hypothetical protein CDD82_5638 [Ophiocordyceps australis]|uniref:Uncharacterized protein n=1 Tax=Ophiocordyceps australis TaxID=1399860 RepID=A0A2C5Y4W3_9HYPO|nr:hypothetical protein CDD82_5638 [Ophiocordyceps australis]
MHPEESPHAAKPCCVPEPTQCIAAIAPAAPSFSERLRLPAQRLRMTSASNDCHGIMMAARGYSVPCSEAASRKVEILPRPHLVSRAPRPPLRKKKSFALPPNWTFVDGQVHLEDTVNMDGWASAGL